MKRFVLSVLTAAVMLLPTVSYGQADQEMIPSSAMAAIFMKPKAILEAPAMELLPREVLSVLGKKELGFDPCEILEAKIFIDSFSDLESPPGFALIVKCSENVTLSPKLTQRFEKQQLNGKTIFRTPEEETPVIYRPDEKTIIVGMEPFIKKMQSARGAQSKLISLIKERQTNTHYSSFVTIEPVRNLIKDSLPPADQIPPPFRNLLELPDLIDSIVVQADYSKNQMGSLELIAVDEAAGGKIERIFRQTIQTGRQFAMGYIANEMQEQDPDMQEAMAKYADRIGDYLENSLRPQRNGKIVKYSGEGSGSQATNVATIGVLVGMLLPAVQQVREAARRTQSMNNLRQIALANLNYESAYQKFPQDIKDNDGKPLLSWRVAILPFIEENQLYEQFKLDEPWDSPHNIQLLPQMPTIYETPNAPLGSKTVFLGFKGDGTIYGGSQGEKVTFADIRDGSSNTILAVEANAEAAVHWTKPADITFDPSKDVTEVGSLRPGGFNAVFCDGSSRFISNMISQQTLKNLIQMNDGNIINDNELAR